MADVEDTWPNDNAGRAISKLQTLNSYELYERTYTVKFGSIVHILQDAIDTDRLWISDFRDEEISVSPDLFDIIQAAHYLDP